MRMLRRAAVLAVLALACGGVFPVPARAGVSKGPSSDWTPGSACSPDGTISYNNTSILTCTSGVWAITGGGLTGSGSTGYDAIWTSPTAIGTGLIYESGGNVGIGTASPLSVFSVYGGAISDTLSIGTSSTNGVVLANLTAATVGTQQFSPRLHFIGQGWETTDPGESDR